MPTKTKEKEMPTKIESTESNGIILEPKKFNKVSSKHFDTYEDAVEYRDKFLKENSNIGKDDKRRMRIRRRVDGFDVVLKVKKN